MDDRFAGGSYGIPHEILRGIDPGGFHPNHAGIEPARGWTRLIWPVSTRVRSARTLHRLRRERDDGGTGSLVMCQKQGCKWYKKVIASNGADLD